MVFVHIEKKNEKCYSECLMALFTQMLAFPPRSWSCWPENELFYHHSDSKDLL